MQQAMFDPRFLNQSSRSDSVAISFSFNLDEDEELPSHVYNDILDKVGNFFVGHHYIFHHTGVKNYSLLEKKKFELKLKKFDLYTENPICEIMVASKKAVYFALCELSKVTEKNVKKLINSSNNFYIFSNNQVKDPAGLFNDFSVDNSQHISVENISSSLNTPPHQTISIGQFFPQDNGFSETFSLLGPKLQIKLAVEHLEHNMTGKIGSFRS